MTNFFPTDEVKNSDHFIDETGAKNFNQRITFGAAKIASEWQMKQKSLESEVELFGVNNITIEQLNH